MKAVIHVFLKPGVLDVQGKAVEGALHGLGWPSVSGVRVGKTIEFDIDGGAATMMFRIHEGERYKVKN